MAIVKPFKALRPRPEYASKVASVPYDVVNREEARTLAGENPYSFLRVIRSEIEFDDQTSPYAEQVYERARQNLNKLLTDSVLIQDQEPSFYIYQLQMDQHVQTGVVGCSSVDDYDSGRIKIHEKTRPDKEQDRIRHMITIGAHPGPVIIAYRNTSELHSLIEQGVSEKPLYEVTAEDGVVHRIWKTNQTAAFSQAFAAVPYTYVADGHHRTASASKCRIEMKKQNPEHRGDEPYNYFLSVLFPDNELQILPYNRIVKSSSIPDTEILDSLNEVFAVEKDASPRPDKKGETCMYLGGTWYKLSPKAGETLPSDPVEALDVNLLHKKALEPIFGIGDPRTDKNIDFIGGIRGTEELERLVDSGAARCAFSMYPVSIDELFQIADRNALMAPKCTWFEPKLRSGLLVHSFR